MELNQVFHAFEAFVAVAQLLDLLVFLLEVELDLARLYLSLAIVVAEMTVEALTPAEHVTVLSQRQAESATQASILDANLIVNEGRHRLELDLLRPVLLVGHVRVAEVEVL